MLFDCKCLLPQTPKSMFTTKKKNLPSSFSLRVFCFLSLFLVDTSRVGRYNPDLNIFFPLQFPAPKTTRLGPFKQKSTSSDGFSGSSPWSCAPFVPPQFLFFFCVVCKTFDNESTPFSLVPSSSFPSVYTFQHVPLLLFLCLRGKSPPLPPHPQNGTVHLC